MKRLRILALLLAFALLMTGCDLEGMLDSAFHMGSIGGNWTNSEVVGAISEATQVSVKDDFYTAVNKDWILEKSAEIDEEENPAIIGISEVEDCIEQRKRDLLLGRSGDATQNEEMGISKEELAHMEQIVASFAAAAADTEGRDALGVEPLRPFIEAALAITDMASLRSYMLDEGGMNLIGAPFIVLDAMAPREDPEVYYLHASQITSEMLSFYDAKQYLDMNGTGITSKEMTDDIVFLVLRQLGYSDEEIKGYLRDCYTLEYLLAGEVREPTIADKAKYEEQTAILPVEELTELTGEYPLAALLEAYGLTGGSDAFVENPKYMQRIGKIFREENVEEFRAYYVVQTACLCATLLDSATKNEALKIMGREYIPVKSTQDAPPPTGSPNGVEEAAEALTPEEEAMQTVLDDYIYLYMPGIFEELYVAHYCTPERKQAVLEMAGQIRGAMHKMIDETTWLSEESKASCHEKLDYMEMNAEYPNAFPSYLEVDIHDGQTLVAMVHNALAQRRTAYAGLPGTARDRSRWDLAELPTTTVNACYMPLVNAMFIFNGIMADGFTFSTEYPPEVNLARLGAIVGHEITHGFDSSGYRFDKLGFDYFTDDGTLVTHEDQEVFTEKISDLGKWYGTLIPIPGVSLNSKLSGEAIADMGGIKEALYIAGETEGFDYDLFFRSYAELWRGVNTLQLEKYFATDVHPLNFLRANVTLQQFDEFLATYDIQEGDGMYLAAEQRISVW